MGRAVFRVGGSQEIVQEYHRLFPEPVEHVLILRHIVAQLSGHQTALEHPVQLHAQLLLAQTGRPLEVAVVTEDHQGVFGNVVHAAAVVGIEQRQIPVGSGQGDTAFQPVQIPLQRLHQCCVDGLPALLSGDHGPEVIAQARKAAGVEMGLGLGHRQDGSLVGVFRPPLGQHVEKAHDIHFITEKLHPQRVFTGRRKHIHYAAPQGVLTGAFHQGSPGIPRLFQPPGQFLRLQIHAGPQRHRRAAEGCLGHGPQGQRLQRGNLQPRLAHGQIIQLLEPFLLPATGHGGRVVQRQFPGGQNGGFLPQKGPQLLLDPAGGLVILTDHHHGPVTVAVQGGNPMAAGHLARTRHRRRPVCRHGGQELFIFRQAPQGGK